MVKHGSMAQGACLLVFDLLSVANNELKDLLASSGAFEKNTGAVCRVVCDNGLGPAMRAEHPSPLYWRLVDLVRVVHLMPPKTAPAMRCFSSVD